LAPLRRKGTGGNVMNGHRRRQSRRVAGARADTAVNVGSMCTREVVVVGADASVLEAAVLMRDHDVGCLVVVASNAHGSVPIGVLCERGIVAGVVARDAAPGSVRVAEIMDAPALVALECDLIHDVARTMRHAGVRRMPVVEAQGRLTGIVALDDLLSILAEELSATAAAPTRSRSGNAVGQG
jgi:CBS domain-containing protein